MAILTDEQRVIAGLEILGILCRDEAVDCTDSVVRDAVLAAVNAADQWVSNNQANYNAVLPDPFGTWATPRQKASVLSHVMLHRFNLNV